MTMRAVYLFAAVLPLMAQAPDVEKEIALRRLVTDTAIVDYVNSIGQNLYRHANLKVPLVFRVVPGPEAQVLTFPNGLLYIKTGLILTAATEAELAGAIAHQIGHIAVWQDTSHSADLPTFPQGSGLCVRASGPLQFPAMVMNQGDVEARADQLGLDYMYQSGFDPAGLANLYQRLLAPARRRGSVQPVFMLGFPPATRSQADSLRAKMAREIVTTSQFSDVQQRVKAIPPPVPKGPPPSLR